MYIEALIREFTPSGKVITNLKTYDVIEEVNTLHLLNYARFPDQFYDNYQDDFTTRILRNRNRILNNIFPTDFVFIVRNRPDKLLILDNHPGYNNMIRRNRFSPAN